MRVYYDKIKNKMKHIRLSIQKLFKLILNPLKPMEKILKEIEKIEFEKINYQELSEDYFDIIPGKIPILISAPHGARPSRNGKPRDVGEDEYTASIAIILGKLTDAHVIYVKNATKKDPNFYPGTKYKEAIKELVDEHGIKFIADIHGASNQNDFKIDVGIINKKDMNKCSCPSYKDIIEESFKEIIKLQKGQLFNIKFAGKGNAHKGIETVIRFAKDTCKIEAAQFEIRADYRILKRKPDATMALEGGKNEFPYDKEKVSKLINTMKEMIESINAKL
jgi:hypothetical protein